MRIVQITTDNREHHREYGKTTPYFGTAPEALLQGFAQTSDLEVHLISCTQRVMSSPEKLADNIWFHSLHVPKIGWLRTGYQGCIRAIRAKVRELQPDTVHGQGTERECALGAVFSGFPSVITIHGNMAALAKHLHARVGSYLWLAGKLETIALNRARGVICNSAYTEALVSPRARQTWRIPNAIRSAFFQKPLPATAASPLILNVGEITPRKRQRQILRLGKQLHQDGVPLQLAFIGSCTETPYARAFLKDLAEASSLGYAKYLGVLTAERLVECFDTAGALLHFPSEEAFGLVVAEALSRNLKLFGSDVGGVRDIVLGAEGSALFPPDDWPRLEKALREWLTEGCPKPASAAVTVLERYHPTTVAGQHLRAYREILRIKR